MFGKFAETVCGSPNDGNNGMGGFQFLNGLGGFQFLNGKWEFAAGVLGNQFLDYKIFNYLYVRTVLGRCGAVGFYKQLGYNVCERIGAVSRALERLDKEEVSGLESMLQRNLANRLLEMGKGKRKGNESNADQGNGEANKPNVNVLFGDHIEHTPEDVWLRKRINSTSFISEKRPEFDGAKFAEDVWRLWDHSIRDKVLNVDNSAFSSFDNVVEFHYKYLPFPLLLQIGPSCGLAALQLAYSYLMKEWPMKDPESQVDDLEIPDLALLEIAKGLNQNNSTHQNSTHQNSTNESNESKASQAASLDGEMFNIHNFQQLSTSIFPPNQFETAIVSISVLDRLIPLLANPTACFQIFKSVERMLPGGVFIVPFDADPGRVSLIVSTTF